MKKVRTPNERFQNIPAFPWTAHYMQVPDGEGGTLRIAHIDENADSAETVLMLHGEPAWSFLYRKMIPPVLAAGYRVVVPDLPGFGRSDKPAERSDYTYQRFVDWMQAWLEQINLRSTILVCQNWGGLIGLRLATANPERFARIVVANTGLSTGDGALSDAFQNVVTSGETFNWTLVKVNIYWAIQYGDSPITMPISVPNNQCMFGGIHSVHSIL